MIEKTMLGAVLLGEGQLELQELPVPEPGPGEILVRVQAATTCGTDLKIYRRGHPKFPPPMVLGHEFGGDIVAVGKGESRFKPGMRVTANVFGECGECFFCQQGQGNLCENLEYNFGAYASYHLIPASIVRQNTFQIPEHISYSEAAIVEPLVCVVHAFNKIRPKPGEKVAVIGAGGPISLLFIQLLKKAGAGDILAIGHSDFRLKTAESIGATHIINSKKSDPEEMLLDLTGGRGMDLVIECAGNQAAWESAVDWVRPGGKVLWFGGLPAEKNVQIDAKKVHYGEISLLNSHGGTAEDAREAFDLITSGKVDTKSLVTEHLPLLQIDTAFDKMIAGEAIKISLHPEL
jgi:L-iditol 2-dehydrogenase